MGHISLTTNGTTYSTPHIYKYVLNFYETVGCCYKPANSKWSIWVKEVIDYNASYILDLQICFADDIGSFYDHIRHIKHDLSIQLYHNHNRNVNLPM